MAFLRRYSGLSKLRTVERPSTRQFLLLGTVGCHLCDQAEAMLRPLVAVHGLEIELVDISEHDALLRAYGVFIPVLRHLASGSELRWPFSAEDVALLLTR